MIQAVGLLAVAAALAAPAEETFFESRVRPVLAGVCVRCHGPQKASAGLRLDSREALLRGGENGPAVVPGSAAESLLIQAIRRIGDDVTPMPPDKPLSREAVDDLTRWIAAGASWPDRAAPVQAARHWSFEPVKDVAPPNVPGANVSSPIDAFLTTSQHSRGVSPAGPAEKRILIRRATFDLTGLPPTPDQVASFLADTSPEAFVRVVDRLLASPRHGEKWGRAWLDVARYADTAGETADMPVPDAWRYRNYVINAINADKPFDQFLREQIAGDLLARDLPGDAPPDRYAELVTATGYLAVARRFGFDSLKDHFLTIDDTIDTFSKSLLGLTVACARCHDHKYDPVTANDYYALFGIFESTRYPAPGCEKDRVPRDNVPLVPPEEYRRQVDAQKSRVASAEAALNVAESRVAQAAAGSEKALAAGEIGNGGAQDFAASAGTGSLHDLSIRKGEMLKLTVSPKSGHGADSTRIELQIREENAAKRVWDVTRDLLPDAYQNATGFRHDDGLGNKAVWQVWDGAAVPRLLTEFDRDAVGTRGLASWRGAEPCPCLFVNTNEQPVAFQTVKQPARSIALHPGPKGAVVLAWQSPIDGVVSISGRVEDIDASGGDGVGWSLAIGPDLGEALAGSVDALRALNQAKAALDSLPGSTPQGYAVAEGSPHDANLRVKGDPDTRGAVVPRRFLEALGGQPVPSGAGSGRRELAGWICDPKNPLTPRVIVNRVWQGHFGNGLVRTPDNFGVRGEAPTNPELLDWLTARFLADGWSLKALHRRVMLTDAYQRADATDDRDALADPDNLTLWRFDRRRLTAEEIRDALLFVSGDLDPTPAGPHPFPEPKTWSFTQHNPFTAVYDHDRRSVYLMTQRIKRHPFLALFDGPDPNSCTGRRDSTTVPTQALFYLNDPFVHARASGLARRLAPLPDDAGRLDRACRLLFGRPPRDAERAVARRFLAARPNDWAGFLRVLFASNEFVYVD